MGLTEAKDTAALVAAKISMTGDGVMQADETFGEAALGVDWAADAVADAVKMLLAAQRKFGAIQPPLTDAQSTIESGQKTLTDELGLHQSEADYVRDVPARLGKLATRVDRYLHAAGHAEKIIGELLETLIPANERLATDKQALLETHAETGSDIIEMFDRYADATEAFILQY